MSASPAQTKHIDLYCEIAETSFFRWLIKTHMDPLHKAAHLKATRLV